MLVKIFPFDEKLLDGYNKPSISNEDKKRFITLSITMLIAAILYIYVGESSKTAKALYIFPVIVMNLWSFVFILFGDDRKVFLGITLSALSSSNLGLAICLILSRFEMGLLNTCFQAVVSLVFYLILTVVGYRIHYAYQKEKGIKFKRVPWSSSKTAIGVVSGIILSKIISRSLLVFLCWIVWIGVHIALSEIILEYKKYSKSAQNR